MAGNGYQDETNNILSYIIFTYLICKQHSIPSKKEISPIWDRHQTELLPKHVNHEITKRSLYFQLMSKKQKCILEMLALNFMWSNLELTEQKVTKWIHKFKLQSAIIYIHRIVHTVGATTKIYAFGVKWPFCDLTSDQSRWPALIMTIMFLRYLLHQCERLRRASFEQKTFEYFSRGRAGRSALETVCNHAVAKSDRFAIHTVRIIIFSIINNLLLYTNVTLTWAHNQEELCC